MRKYINIKWVSLLILVLILPLSAQTWTIQTIDGSIYKKVDLISIDGDALVYKDKKGTWKTQISDITQLQSIKDEKLSGWKVELGLCGIGVGGIIGFLGLWDSASGMGEPAISISIIIIGSLVIYKSFTWAFYSKDKQTYDFNKISAEKKKEILIRLIEHGELWSKSST
jgi:hypothetical protein